MRAKGPCAAVGAPASWHAGARSEGPAAAATRAAAPGQGPLEFGPRPSGATWDGGAADAEREEAGCCDAEQPAVRWPGCRHVMSVKPLCCGRAKLPPLPRNRAAITRDASAEWRCALRGPGLAGSLGVADQRPATRDPERLRPPAAGPWLWPARPARLGHGHH